VALGPLDEFIVAGKMPVFARDSREERRRLNERLRAAFIAGAEDNSRRCLGRGLTREELERVLRRYPGDM
jgi:hypothetical protein